MAEICRVAALKALSHCPVCGKPQMLFKTFGEAERSAEVRFHCGASFATFENLPIRPSYKCAGPSYTAALMIERELDEAVALAGYLGGS